MPFKTVAEKKTQTILLRLADQAVWPELLTSLQVRGLLGIKGARTLRVMVTRGQFPPPLAFNSRFKRWPRAVVAAWFAGHTPCATVDGDDGADAEIPNRC
jgi:predicted DNA-binding transcriptional regulator AlpA